MKKNNPYITDDQIDLGDVVRTLWRNKILILSISIICGLASYLYVSFQPQEFRTEIQIKNPPPQLFVGYNQIADKNKINIHQQFISDFRLNFLSITSLESFLEESGEFDNFKAYLKLRNISVGGYFENKINEVKEKNLIMPNRYFLVFTKELDGNLFLNKYTEFAKKITIFELKKNLKKLIENEITNFENALENAKLINLEIPAKIIGESNQFDNDLFYKGSKILSQEVSYLKRLLIKLENDQFNYDPIANKAYMEVILKKNAALSSSLLLGFLFGTIFSMIIIYFKSLLN